MPIQKSMKGRLTAAQETREVPPPRGHKRRHGKPGAMMAADNKGMGNFSRKAASRLRLKTGRNPPQTKRSSSK